MIKHLLQWTSAMFEMAFYWSWKCSLFLIRTVQPNMELHRCECHLILGAWLLWWNYIYDIDISSKIIKVLMNLSKKGNCLLWASFQNHWDKKRWKMHESKCKHFRRNDDGSGISRAWCSFIINYKAHSTGCVFLTHLSSVIVNCSLKRVTLL